MNKQIMIAALAIMLTARLGTITYNDHKETWYDLPMQKQPKEELDGQMSFDDWNVEVVTI